jgi:potassium-dependent mechanosensitive channel
MLVACAGSVAAQPPAVSQAPVATVAPAIAAPEPATAAPAPFSTPLPQYAALSLKASQQTLNQMQSQLQASSNDAQLAALEARAGAIQSSAEAAIAARTNDLAHVAGALKHFAPHGRRPQSAAERRDSAPLLSEQSALRTQLQQAQGVAAAANYTFNLVAERRRESFSARVLQRSDSPLSPNFWTSLADAAGGDIGRLGSLARNSAEAAVEAPEPRGVGMLALGLVCGAIFLLPARRWLEALARRRSAKPSTPQRATTARGLPHTAYAVWVAMVDIGLPALAAVVLHLTAQWGGLLAPKADTLFDAAVVAVTWGAAILTLGRVLATDPDVDRRLLNLPDDAAGRIRVSLWAVALITGAGFLLTRLNYVIGASVAATIASNCLLSLAYASVAGLILVGFGRGRAPASSDESAAEVARAPIWTLISLALTGAIVITLGAVLLGYTTLAALVSNQIFWLSVIAAVSYLLLRFVDDLTGALFRPKGWAARALFVLFSLRRTTVGQLGVLVSAALQLIIVIGAISLALTPFGQSGNLLLAHIGQLGQAVHLGSAVISPAAVTAGVATLAIGMGVVNLIRSWVVRRYLPVTGWDAGLRNSVSTGVGYLGVGVTLVCALAAMGLGFQQIALIASALSVGIGFGLQQIVQNFVSGIILLVERPVKVGDWVSVDGVEGDVRRIRVRSTEILTFDRSTVIVPNSDLITKSVQNKTLGDPRGRIQLQVSIANAAQAQAAKDVILAVAEDQDQILKDPAPVVYIDSLASGGAVNFNCYLYVDSPRNAYKSRSALYFEILERFAKQNIAFIGAAGPTNIVVEPGPAMEALLAGRTQT